MIKNKKIQMIFLILVSIIVLALGLTYLLLPNNKQASEAGGYKEYVYIKAYWYNGTSIPNYNITIKEGSYVSADGNTYNSSVGSISASKPTVTGNVTVNKSYSASTSTTNTSNGDYALADVYSKSWHGVDDYSVKITLSRSPISGFTSKGFIQRTMLEERDSVNAFPDSITENFYSKGTYSSYSTSGSTNALGIVKTYYSTYYAIFYPKSYTIRFYENGGDWGTSSTYKTTTTVFYEDYNIVSGNPTRTGYTFDGWYTSSSGGSKVTSSTAFTNTSNKYLYAHWDANSYTLTANANGGSIPSTSGWSGTGTKSTKSVDYDSSYGTLPTPTRTGYTFDGWYDASSGGNKVTSSTKMTTLGETIYAHWTANGYTLTMNANGGSISSNSNWTGSGSSVTKTVKYDSQYGTLPTSSNISRTGYTFDNWWTSGSGGSRVYTTTVMNSTSGATIYAHWTPNIYKITLDKQSGSGGTNEIYLKYNTAWCSNSSGTATITSITKPTRTGYTFGGYYTDKNGAGTQIINASGSITGSKTYIASADTLYAKWTANTYSIVFDKNGGSGSMSNQSMTYDKASNLTTNTYTRQGYYFVGWSKTKLGVQSTIPTSNIYKDEASVNNLATSGSITLYAVWLDTWANHTTTPTGSGSSTSPYIIDSAEDLAWMINNHGSALKYFKQTKAINLSKYNWYPIGTGDKPFKGVYDGQGFAIDNINIPNITNAGNKKIQSNVGLFGFVNSATITNIYLTNANVYGNDGVGLIASNSTNTTINANVIENCKIYAENKFGALVAISTSGTIKNNLIYVTTSGGTSTSGLYNGSITIDSNLVEENGKRSKTLGSFTDWAKVFNRLLPDDIVWIGEVESSKATSSDIESWINGTLD